MQEYSARIKTLLTYMNTCVPRTNRLLSCLIKFAYTKLMPLLRRSSQGMSHARLEIINQMHFHVNKGIIKTNC